MPDEKKEEVKKEVSPEKTDWQGILERAEKIAARIELANQEAAKILEKNQEIMVKQMLGGKTSAGIQPEQPKQLTSREYAKKVMAGEIELK